MPSGYKKDGSFAGKIFQKGKRNNPIGEFKKGQLANNWNGFKKGHKPTSGCFKKGHIPICPFKKGHIPTNGFKKGNIPIHKFKKGNHPKTEYKKGHQSDKKNKTWEEMYGVERAKEMKEQQRLRRLGTKASEETKRKISESSKNPSFEIRMKMRKHRATQIFPIKDTKIEVKIQKFLTELRIEFLTHQYVEIEHSYQSDIFIPIQEGITQPTIIECDGDYWHGNIKKFPNLNKQQIDQIEEDKIRTQEIIEKGYRVIRLWEHEIKKMTLKGFKNKFNQLSAPEPADAGAHA